MQKKQEIKHFGFWSDNNIFDFEARKEEVMQHVALGWNRTEEGKACVAFFRAGKTHRRQKGYAVDRIDGVSLLGTADMIHGQWIYPQKWEHYILTYSVKPWEPELIQDAVAWYTKDVFF